MKNVTVTLAPEVALWARVRAAELDMSLSRYLGEILRREMDGRDAYDAAMRQFLGREAQPLRDPRVALPSRAELHER